MYQLYCQVVQENLEKLSRREDQELLTETMETLHQMKLAAYNIRDPEERRQALLQTRIYRDKIQDFVAAPAHQEQQSRARRFLNNMMHWWRPFSS